MKHLQHLKELSHIFDSTHNGVSIIDEIGKKITLGNSTIVANKTPILEDNRVVGAISVFQDISEYVTQNSFLKLIFLTHRQDLEF